MWGCCSLRAPSAQPLTFGQRRLRDPKMAAAPCSVNVFEQPDDAARVEAYRSALCEADILRTEMGQLRSELEELKLMILQDHNAAKEDDDTPKPPLDSQMKASHDLLAHRGRQVVLTVRFPSQGRQVEDLEIIAHTNDTLGAIRRQIYTRVKVNNASTKLDLFLGTELLDPADDKKLIGQLPIKDKAVLSAKLSQLSAQLPSSPESSSDSSAGSPQHHYDGPHADAEACLPGVLMSKQPKYTQFLFKLADLGSTLPMAELRDSALGLLKLLPAGHGGIENMRITQNPLVLIAQILSLLQDPVSWCSEPLMAATGMLHLDGQPRCVLHDLNWPPWERLNHRSTSPRVERCAAPPQAATLCWPAIKGLPAYFTATGHGGIENMRITQNPLVLIAQILSLLQDPVSWCSEPLMAATGMLHLDGQPRCVLHDLNWPPWERLNHRFSFDAAVPPAV
ncbi:hypothetical protein HPB51_019045 [Rhipicephalus microplus]|uniref:UBP24/USP9X/USP9Y ubiquitin-like domain-containing protein n=1 Tax=Rhipicephalus microplus TaxID=6941 RepID=A0A9J6D6C1_RHIMP|nr:hypothetical protein HPB51_019045 [Rhipicephalus microplus]